MKQRIPILYLAPWVDWSETAADPRYEPLTRGMQAALPYLDLFAPAHSLEGLAALPSLHVGWAMWVALYVSGHSRSRLLRRSVWIYPALMTIVVMATANHYLLDALAGIACACLGSWLPGYFASSTSLL